MNSKYFYHDMPLFGLDIGSSTIKVMQISKDNKKYEIQGYGICEFNESATNDGVIIDHKLLAESAVKLFKDELVGEIDTRRVAISVPATKTYTRTIELPLIKDDEVPDAVRIEAEQYIPMSIDELYLDHSIISRTEDTIEVLAVATPKKIIDSRIELCRILDLEPIAFDTTILSAARLFERQEENSDIPAVLVDFGSVSTEITVYDKTIIVTGTIMGGGDVFTENIAKELSVSREEAHIIKTKYGMGRSQKQAQVLKAIEPVVNQLGKEIQRMIRYHEERSGAKEKIGQIITMGGGANLPGLSDYFTNMLRLPVRTCDPLSNFDYGKLKPPSNLERSIYATSAGLALIQPTELFKND